jgi:putative ABC transport system substrate-binding protein
MLVGGLIATPRLGRAQQERTIPVVGVLHDRPAGPSTSIRTMQEELSKLGYVEGQTVTFEVRYAGGKPEALQTLARELVRRTVDVIFAIGPAALRAATDATATIPIVTINLETDPVAAGYARSVARPGGNVTGLFLNQPGLTGKWLELIKEAIPGIHRVALLRDRTSGPWQLDAARLFTALTVLDFRYAPGPEPPLLPALRTWLSPAGPASAASSPG